MKSIGELKKLNESMLEGLRDYSKDEYMANFGGSDAIETSALIIMRDDGVYDCLIRDEFGDLVTANEIVRENEGRKWLQGN